jgi:hypothetical protein
VSGTVSNGGGIDVPISPGTLWFVRIRAHWNGAEDPSVVTAEPPLFPGEVWMGSGLEVMDVRPVSAMPSGTSDLGYTVHGLVGRDESTTVHARAFPPAGYPTPITCDLTVEAWSLT